MTIHHMIFHPTLSGHYGSFDEMPLDYKTPRGLFVGAGRNRYLVCDGPFDRFAVVLDHAEFAPFTYFTLGELPADTGSFEGVGKFHLGEDSEIGRGDQPLGTLEAERELLRLHVQNLAGLSHWVIVAYGTGGEFSCTYEDWSLMVDDDLPFYGRTQYGEA